MADIYLFFEEGIKSYIEQSFIKYLGDAESIFHKSFDNNLINPLFINDITLFKNLIQKNKLKSEIWGHIGDLFDQKINQLLNIFNESIKNMKTKILKYTQKIKNSTEIIEAYNTKMKEMEEEINNNNKNLNKDNDDNVINIEEKENLSDIKCKEYISKNNSKLLNKIAKYNKKKEEEEKSLSNHKMHLAHKEKYILFGEISILKLKILHISLIILINEVNNQENNNQNYNKENNYKLLNDYIIEFIDECEKRKDHFHIPYTLFINTYIIKIALIINKQGYKDINISFLNQILNSLNNIKKIYSNSYISDLIKNIEKLISKPDTFLCRNAFTILKNASFKKIIPRSRNNSFDKNDVVNNNNVNNKIEGNRKIEEFIDIKKKDNKEKSDSEDDEFDIQKKISSVISFKNSSLNNNNNLNYNFQSQSSLCLGDTNKYKSFHNDSAQSNNSLLFLENQNGTNLCNSSKFSLDDSMSIQGMYRSGSCSELLGINSRLASQLPSIRNTTKEKEKKILEKFKKKIKMKKPNIERKNSNEKVDKLFNKEIRKIVNNKFYNNGSTCDKEKNTTATDNKKNNNLEGKTNTNINSDILVAKTPIKNGSENMKEKEEKLNKNILKETGIKRNLQLLFNQQTDKY